MYSAPFAVDFDVTLKCNLNCLHCNVVGGNPLQNEMNTEQIITALDQFYNAGVYDIALTGGEILCRKDWKDIVKFATTDKEWKVVINTNGILWNEEDIRFIETLKDKISISISLDGYNPQTFGVLRKNLNGEPALKEFDKIVKNICSMISNNIPTHINYTITNKTLPNFFKTLDFALFDLKVDGFLGIKFFPYGRGQEHYDILEINYEDWKVLLEKATILKQDSKYKNFLISITAPWEMYMPLLEAGYKINEIETIWDYQSPLRNNFFNQKHELGCKAGITSCAVSPDGNITPCGSVSARIPELYCGKLDEKNLISIWNESPVLKKLRELKLKDIDNGECLKCELKNICGGGCRARAFVINGKLNAKDPACPKRRDN